MIRKLILSGVAVAVLGLYVGCNNNRSEPAASVESGSSTGNVERKTTTEDHHDKPGGHGGMLISLGADNYHAEAVFEKGGKLRLFILGKDESRVQDVEKQEITAHVYPEGDASASEPLVLRPEPQTGDADGKTSQFVGQLPKPLQGKPVVVTFAITIQGDRFRRSFTSASPRHDDGMPVALSEEEERELYLTPGGKYTEADIEANGHMTATEKFRGLRSKHDARAKAGDRICPISETKSNPKFVWFVGGKPYEFCCPPCVDEFVKKAKEQPDQVLDPEAYVKK